MLLRARLVEMASFPTCFAGLLVSVPAFVAPSRHFEQTCDDLHSVCPIKGWFTLLRKAQALEQLHV